MNLLAAVASLDPADGWGAYALGLLGGLTSLGVRCTVLAARHARASGLPGVKVIPCLSSPLGALDRPPAIAWNAGQLLRHAKGADLLHFMVEPYATASVPFRLPPTCITIHGTYAVAPFNGRLHTRMLYRAALRRARAVVCVSRFTRDRLLGQVALDNVTVIQNGHGVRPEDPRAVAETGKIQGQPILLGVGALKPRKGYHVALEAVAKLRGQFPDLRYYLVGDTSDKGYVARLREQIAALCLESHAVITGPVSDAELATFYRQADLFLLTPVNAGTAFEGFGIVYLEANAYGLPVVGSWGCGAEEAIEDGVTGLLAPQHDVDAIALCAARILGDPAFAASLGAAGRIRANQQTFEAVASQYLQLYESRLARGRGGLRAPPRMG